MDRETAFLQLSSGMRCLPDCGDCCENPNVEASVLEAIPLANDILLRHQEEDLLSAVEHKQSQDDHICVLYRKGPGGPEKGRCSNYAFRPLLCRLFGFAARRDKYGRLELCPCKHIKADQPESTFRAQIFISTTPSAPIYQDLFMKVASLDPNLGFRRLPINLAIKQAIEYLHWKHPADIRCKRAA